MSNAPVLVRHGMRSMAVAVDYPGGKGRAADASGLAAFDSRLLQVLRQGERRQEVVKGAPAVEEEGDDQALLGGAHQGGLAGGGQRRGQALLRQPAGAERAELAAHRLAVDEYPAERGPDRVEARVGEAVLGELI